MNWLAEFWKWLVKNQPRNVIVPELPEPEFDDIVFHHDGVSGQITENFHVDEFATRDGTPVPQEFYGNVQLLAENLQVFRDHTGKSVKVISGYRHPAYNKRVGGAKSSQHLTASAGDLVVKGMSARKVADTISKLIRDGAMKKGGLGRYPHFTHYDIRPRNARWGSNTRKSKK